MEAFFSYSKGSGTRAYSCTPCKCPCMHTLAPAGECKNRSSPQQIFFFNFYMLDIISPYVVYFSPCLGLSATFFSLKGLLRSYSSYGRDFSPCGSLFATFSSMWRPFSILWRAFLEFFSMWEPFATFSLCGGLFCFYGVPFWACPSPSTKISIGAHVCVHNSTLYTCKCIEINTYK